MVVGYKSDACSEKWRDDPVRAALDKKAAKEAALAQKAAAAQQMRALLKERLEKGAASSAMAGADGPGGDAEAVYKREMERQRQKMMDEGSVSDSSESSVYDPLNARNVNKRDRREKKRERKEKEAKEARKEKKRRKKEKKARAPFARHGDAPCANRSTPRRSGAQEGEEGAQEGAAARGGRRGGGAGREEETKVLLFLRVERLVRGRAGSTSSSGRRREHRDERPLM